MESNQPPTYTFGEETLTQNSLHKNPSKLKLITLPQMKITAANMTVKSKNSQEGI